MEMRGLCEDLLEEILSRIPVKPVVKMKCVSKSWNRIISRMRGGSRSFFNRSRLLVHRSPHSARVSLLNIQYHGRHSSTPFDFYLKDCTFLSSNGLLLCIHHDELLGGLYVCNPVNNQWVAIRNPYLDEYDCQRFGFAFDGVGFKVIIILSLALTTRMRIAVFDSKVNNWTRKEVPVLHQWTHKEVPVLYQRQSGFVYSIDKDCPCVFVNGAIHWKLNGEFYGDIGDDGSGLSRDAFLVYILEKDYFKVIKLPQLKDSIRWNLWETEGHHLCICSRTITGFEFWEYTCHYASDEGFKIEQVLTVNYPTILRSIEAELPPDIVPPLPSKVRASYILDDLQFMLTKHPEIITCCSLERQTAIKVWSFDDGRGDLSTILPFFYTSVDLAEVIDQSQLFNPQITLVGQEKHLSFPGMFYIYVTVLA